MTVVMIGRTPVITGSNVTTHEHPNPDVEPPYDTDNLHPWCQYRVEHVQTEQQAMQRDFCQLKYPLLDPIVLNIYLVTFVTCILIAAVTLIYLGIKDGNERSN